MHACDADINAGPSLENIRIMERKVSLKALGFTNFLN